MPVIDVRLLGDFRVRVDGVERRIAARKQRVLVATLAIRAQRRTRERMIAELWPESDEERGRQNLRHALYEINALIDGRLIAATRDELALEPDVTVDARSFEEASAGASEADLERAFTLYEGDLCTECEGDEAEAERARLRGIFAGIAERLAARVMAGDPARAARVAQRVIEIDPYREEAHRTLLAALAARGDLAGAALHFRRLTTLLRDELGVEPSPATRTLYASLGRAHAAAPTVRRPSLEPPAQLIGRRAEYAALMGPVLRAIDGRGGSALVLGDAGSGKSRLLEELASVAERHGLRVLRARATAAEGALPFQLWIDALGAHSTTAAALGAPWPAVLATLLPDLAPESAGVVAPELRRTRLFEGVARLLARLAETAPTVVVLDDLHHADPDSIHLFHYVARTSAQRRLATLVASRPVGAASPLAEARASLEPREQLAVVELGPLPADAVLELLLRFGVRAEDARWLAPRLAAWSGGNTFFVLELMRGLVDQGRITSEDGVWRWVGERPAEDRPLAPDLPHTVRQAILARVDALPASARRLLELASVLGVPAPLGLISAVAARDELAVAEELAPAFETGLVQDVRALEGTVTFAHELVRDATYQRIPAAVRAAIHRRAAAALEESGGTDGAIAHHLTAGGDVARAAVHWQRSARKAEARFAHDEAIAAYRSALDAVGPASPLRADILTSIGDAHLRRGSAGPAIAAFEDALETLAPTEVDRRAALLTRIAGAARFYQAHPKAAEYAALAFGHYRTSGSPAQLADALVALAWCRYMAGDAAAAATAADEARALARAAGAARSEAQAIHAAILARWLSGELLTAPDEPDVDRIARTLGDDDVVAVLLGLVATAHLRRGQPDEAVSIARRAYETARRVGSLRVQLETAEDLVGALRVTDNAPAAIALADEVLADVATLELDEPPRMAGELVTALAVAGDEARGVALAEQLIASSSAQKAPVHASPALEAASALMTLGRLPPRSLIDSQRPSCRTCAIGWHAIAGRHAALGGDGERALASADDIDELVRTGVTRTSVGTADHIRALVHARSGQAAAARESAARAREAFRSVGRLDAIAILERDLARVPKIHA